MSAPDVRTARDVAELRLWLAEQWAPGRPFATTAALHHAMRSIAAANPVAYASTEQGWLQHATLWWVAEDMVDLLLASARAIPDDVTLHDLPAMPGAGLVVFAKPWLGIDADDTDRTVQVDAMLWGGGHLPPLPHVGRPEPSVSVSVASYRRLDFAMGLAPDELGLATAVGGLHHANATPVDAKEGPDASAMDALVAEHRRRGSQQPLAGTWRDGQLAPDGTELHGTYSRDPERKGGRTWNLTGTTWVPLGRCDWPVGDAIGSAPWDMGATPAARASMVEDRKVLAAFWHLMHQEGIAATELVRPARPTVRRGERAGVARELSGVQVVTLRKLERTGPAEPDDAEHPARERTHRWLVAGHWRWQPYGPGRQLRRLTYVRPHVKGPEDKPLRVPTRVNAWVR